MSPCAAAGGAGGTARERRRPMLGADREPSEGLSPVILDHLAIMVTGKIARETTSPELLADEGERKRYPGVSCHTDALLES